MAAPMKVGLRSIVSYSKYTILRRGKGIKSCSSIQKCKYSSGNGDDSSQNQREPRVGMSKHGDVLICWHPEPTHPYQHTLPMNYSKDDVAKGKRSDNVVKDELIENLKLRNRPDGPTIHELANITHTTKHGWFPSSKHKLRKKNPPKDREGI